MEFIEVKLTKCTVYLTPAEIRQLLQSNPDLYATAIKRGKAFKRAQR